MFTKDQKKRMELVKGGVREANCIGTAFYVLGYVKRDGYIGPPESRWRSGFVDETLAQMNRIQNPQEGGIIVFKKEKIVEHMGIVIQKNPNQVFHRTGFLEAAKVDPLEKVISDYQQVFPTVEYYIKKK